MSDTNKVVKISADVSELQQGFNLVTTDGQSFYRTLTKDAEAYSNVLKDQSKYINDIMAQEQKRIELEYRAISIAAEKRKIQDLEGITDPTQRSKIVAGHKEAALIERQDYLTQKEAITEAKLMHMNNQDKYTPGMEEANVIDESSGKFSRLAKLASGAGAAAKTAGMSTAAGLGIGAAFGVAGIIYEVARSGVELQESMYSLNAVMKDSSMSSTSWATDIGKTTSGVNELMISLSMISGGTVDIRKNARAISEASRAFNIDESMLAGLGAFGLYGKSTSGAFESNQNITNLLDIIIGESQKAKVINAEEGNFAFLSTQIQNLQNLFELSSQQLLRPSSTNALNTLTAFQGLGVRSGGGKDPRTMQDIMSFNQGITTPANDFTRAFLYSSLDQGGGYIETKKRMEQGIFGEGVLQDVISNLLDQYGNEDQAIMALSSMFPSLGIQASEQYVKAFSGKESSKFFDELTRTNTAAETGINIGARARELTPLVSQMQAGITNTAAGLGVSALEGIKTLVDSVSGSFSNSSKTVAEAHSELRTSMKGMQKSIDNNTGALMKSNDLRNKNIRTPWKDINE